MKFNKYSPPQLIDLSLKSVSGACSPFGSLDNTNDCSEGNEASGGNLVTCQHGTSPGGAICAGGLSPNWGNWCFNGSGV